VKKVLDANFVVRVVYLIRKRYDTESRKRERGTGYGNSCMYSDTRGGDTDADRGGCEDVRDVEDMVG